MFHIFYCWVEHLSGDRHDVPLLFSAWGKQHGRVCATLGCCCELIVARRVTATCKCLLTSTDAWGNVSSSVSSCWLHNPSATAQCTRATKGICF
jgi:hypothetical protein